MRPDSDFVAPGPFGLLKCQPIGFSDIFGIRQASLIACRAIDPVHDRHVKIAIKAHMHDMNPIFGIGLCQALRQRAKAELPIA